MAAIFRSKASKDAWLSSAHPEQNLGGKRPGTPGMGFGQKSPVAGGQVSYPVLILDVNGGSFAPKDSLVLGGFDLSAAPASVASARLRLFVNFAGAPRERVTLLVHPLARDWDENAISYLDVYSGRSPGADFTDLVAGQPVQGSFDVASNSADDFTRLPCANAPGWVEIDVLPIVRSWIADPQSAFGLLVEPPWWDDARHTALSPIGRKANLGRLEIAPSEWASWDGQPPGEGFLPIRLEAAARELGPEIVLD
ncbi:MAG: DNRLRE domain-containing protein [Deltaproteobacteria bacterium]|nr:DNRLRE domain-containing protein [Deltaproteobacteria bacterium]